MNPNHLLLSIGLALGGILWFIVWELVRYYRELKRDTRDELTWWLSKGGLLLFSIAAYCILLLGRR